VIRRCPSASIGKELLTGKDALADPSGGALRLYPRVVAFPLWYACASRIYLLICPMASSPRFHEQACATNVAAGNPASHVAWLATAVSTAIRATTEHEKHAIPVDPRGESAKADFAVSGATSVAGRAQPPRRGLSTTQRAFFRAALTGTHRCHGELPGVTWQRGRLPRAEVRQRSGSA